MPGSPSPSAPLQPHSPPQIPSQAHSQSQSPPPMPRAQRRASTSPARAQKRISRKVIRTLEGLGHGVDSDEEGDARGSGNSNDNEAEAEDEDEGEVAASLRADAIRAGKQRELGGGPTEKKKIDWEIPRKVFHSSIGFITLGLYLTPSISPRAVALVLWGALAVIAPTDVVRLRVPAVERVYEKALGFLMRESERTGTNGTLWYILGVNFALTFYPIDVATVAILILSWADTAASTLGRMYGPRTAPLPSSVSLAWLPAWVWVPGFLLAAPSPPSAKAITANGHANGSVQQNGHLNGHVKENPRGAPRRLKTPFAPRKSTAGFSAACVAGAAVALAFWWGVGGMNIGRGVAEMRTVKEGVDGTLAQGKQYHSQYSIAGQYLRSEEGAWARRWVPEGLIGGVAPQGLANAAATGSGGHATTPARFGVRGVAGLVALVLTAGVVSGVAEALDLGGLDDNLTLPIISGGALMLFFRVWGWAVGAA
ncbi:hypothetical protein C8F04DRAFT_1280332 [Mycena alexandri]|uniref:Phosphatidate cytidylyltransferase n=1 Tax=Mycena alexandri TaxID=1745969 RepID=A0AAD6RX63_9AGAR|nr:hypothetical protein C8F04DRAFT_1280332 [Mycena alexandri]